MKKMQLASTAPMRAHPLDCGRAGDLIRCLWSSVPHCARQVDHIQAVGSHASARQAALSLRTSTCLHGSHAMVRMNDAVLSIIETEAGVLFYCMCCSHASLDANQVVLAQRDALTNVLWTSLTLKIPVIRSLALSVMVALVSHGSLRGVARVSLCSTGCRWLNVVD